MALLSLMSTRRIRNEMRTLAPAQWDAVVKAMWIMKTTSQEEGQARYGPQFKSYDMMVLKHVKAALHPAGDQAHFREVFALFHLMWTLEVEGSLVAIDPSILGVPYWNCLKDPQGVFTQEYLGSFSGTGPEYSVLGKYQYQIYLVSQSDCVFVYFTFTNSSLTSVLDGRFARWPVPWSRELGVEYSNAYGYMRAPLNPVSSPYVTRRGGSMCGYFFGFGEASAWDECMQTPPSIDKWLECTGV